MAKITSIEGRKRLDETLASSALAEKDNVRRLLKEQLLKSSLHVPTGEETRGNVEMGTNIEIVVKKYEIEIWEFLEMLRSASDYNAEESKSHGWKLKQDNDEFRVMYREGPQGTPFHTLLVEGYINGPLDSCLCVGVESSLYPHWKGSSILITTKYLEASA